MSDGSSSLLGWIRSVPADFVGIVLVVVLANAAVSQPAGIGYPVSIGSPVRAVVGVLFVLFVPGYALVGALFPGAGRPPNPKRSGPRGRLDTASGGTNRKGIDRWERLALSFAVSLAIVPLLAVAVTLSPVAFTTTSIFLTIGLVTLVGAVIAVKRHFALPADERFRTSTVDWLGGIRQSVTGSGSRGSVLLNVMLVVSVSLAVGTLGFAVLAPPDGESFTEFYVLSENGEDELVAAEYPDSFTPGEPQQIYTGIENQEGETVEYNVVIQLQRVGGSEESPEVIERQEIDRFSVALSHNETWVEGRNVSVSGELSGTDLRLKFLLYKDSVPETPAEDTAYRDLHIWIDVQDAGQGPGVPVGG
jgi:uncharacterized membrane protein